MYMNGDGGTLLLHNKYVQFLEMKIGLPLLLEVPRAHLLW